MSRRSTRLRRRLLIVTFGLLLVTGLRWYRMTWGPSLAFESIAWCRAITYVGQSVARGNNTRARMLSDLLAHHLKAGSTRKEVVQLMGPGNAEGDNVVIYNLLQLPTRSQSLVATLRWHTNDPRLELEFSGVGDGALLTHVRLVTEDHRRTDLSVGRKEQRRPQ